MTVSNESGIDPDEARRARLERFRGHVDTHDKELAEYWSQRSPAEHAKAMVDLADYADMMAAQTGFEKDPNEMFPSLRRWRRPA